MAQNVSYAICVPSYIIIIIIIIIIISETILSRMFPHVKSWLT